MTTFHVATVRTCREIQQCMFAHGQSDEVSILLNGWGRANSEVWFGGKIDKINSVAASIFTANFAEIAAYTNRPFGRFDCRYWNIPESSELFHLATA